MQTLHSVHAKVYAKLAAQPLASKLACTEQVVLVTVDCNAACGCNAEAPLPVLIQSKFDVAGGSKDVATENV